MQFDVFISHAWEDKDSFVRELSEKLVEHRIEVWYDEFSLNIGDSLRRSLDFGLSRSRYGIVVLSNNFFNKQWTNWELDGLVQRQNNSSNNVIIPIWHNIDKDEILKYSPSLADKIAIKSDIGMSRIIDKINNTINPKGSTLVVARDYLIEKKFNPPILTDDWWLDVLEYRGDTIFENDYLKFDIHFKGYEPKNRGVYIANQALQMHWRQSAIENNISQLTHPEKLIQFIESQPGLMDMCISQPLNTALYFPQLTINGFNNFMEPHFDKIAKNYNNNGKYTCVQEMALRTDNFGYYSSDSIACFYFTGPDTAGLGPSTRLYELFDCLIWLLSSNSNWLPKNVQEFLLDGLCKWTAWYWGSIPYEGYETPKYTGEFLNYLLKKIENNQLRMPVNAKKDLKNRILVSIDVLSLNDTLEQIIDSFFNKKIIESWVNSKFNKKIK